MKPSQSPSKLMKQVFLITKGDEKICVPSATDHVEGMKPSEAENVPSPAIKKAHTSPLGLDEAELPIKKKYASASAEDPSSSFLLSHAAGELPKPSRSESGPVVPTIKNPIPKYPSVTLHPPPMPATPIEKMAAIFTELGNISQGLTVDLPMCQSLTDEDPQIMNYWTTLNNYVLSLNQVAKDVSGIQSMMQAGCFPMFDNNNKGFLDNNATIAKK